MTKDSQLHKTKTKYKNYIYTQYKLVSFILRNKPSINIMYNISF